MKYATLAGISNMARMPIPNDWDGVSKCCYVVEWPNSPDWRAIFLGFITTPSVGFFWDESTGIVVDAQEVGRQIINDNSCLWESLTMGCLEDLTQAIEAQTQVLSNTSGSCGCGGSQGSGIFEEEGSSFVDNGIDTPAGYADRAEYDTFKCGLAQLVIDRIIQSLTNISILNLAGLTASAVVSGLGLAALITVGIPFVNIIAIAGFLLVIWAAQGSLQSAMNEAKTYLQNTLDICLIYDAETASDAQAAVWANIDAQAWTVSVTADVLKNMFSLDAINLAFNAKPDQYSSLPTADCSACGAASCADPLEDQFEVVLGTVTSITDNGSTLDVTIDSEPNPGLGDQEQVSYRLLAAYTDIDCCFEHTAITIDAGTAVTNGGTLCNDTFYGGNNTPAQVLSPEKDFKTLIWRTNTGNNPFTISITIQRPD